MAVTNNVDLNVQNQIPFEQLFQQSQPQLTRAEIQAQNDFINQMNSAASAAPVSSPVNDNTETEQVSANADAVSQQPAIPASETAQVQQLNADANAIKSDLNQKADQQIALGGTLAPISDKPSTDKPSISFNKPVGSHTTGISDAEKQFIIAKNPSNQYLFNTDNGKQAVVWEGKIPVEVSGRDLYENRGLAVSRDVRAKLFGENPQPPNVTWGIADDTLTVSNSHPYADNNLYSGNSVYVTVKQQILEVNDSGTLVAGNAGVGAGNAYTPQFKEQYQSAYGLQFSETKGLSFASYDAKTGDIVQTANGKKFTTAAVEELSSGFRAAVFVPQDPNDNRRIVAFTGTQPTDRNGVDIATDIQGALNSRPEQYKQADELISYLKEKAKEAGTNLILTGHSLGGGLAAYTAIRNDLFATTIESAPIGVYDNVQLGKIDIPQKYLTENAFGSPAFRNDINNVTHYWNESDIVPASSIAGLGSLAGTSVMIDAEDTLNPVARHNNPGTKTPFAKKL
jgi:hypothetical protein